MYDLQRSPTMMSQDPSKGFNPCGGKTFFVRETLGDDDNEGTDPAFPLATLEKAYLKCADSMHDYIFCQYFSTLSDAPLSIGKRTIHFIALSHGNFDSRNDLNGGDAISLEFCAAGRDTELAGFNIGGDGSKVAIDITDQMSRCHIHHCTFGCNFACAGGISGGEIVHSSIDHCLFGQLFEDYAIRSNLLTSMFLHNIFQIIAGTGGIVPAGPSHHNIILDNTFMVPDSVNGEAITLTALDTYNLVNRNYAMMGMLRTGYTYNPFLDLAANTVNAWGMNYRGNDVIEPAGI